ncbi:MBL fold metallo-hydrolase [Sphingomonas sp. 179-I 2A4 NHS]|uniref:MBL fold metallo-hydrolase n=1 Tax=unclassified Sphingomonas TaxID=196159 RepID=UPI00387946B8
MKSVLLIGAVLFAALAPVQAPAQQAAATAIKPPAVQAPGYYRVALGDYKITVLTDGTTPVPFGDLLHGASRESLADAFRKAGESLDRETSINSFLIDTGERRILIEAGAGRLFGDCCGRLPATLMAAGYAPETIDAVLLTHVHGDHSGGLTVDGRRVFPNAYIYLAKRELDYWLNDEARARAKPSHQKMFEEGRAALAPYRAAGRIRTFTAPSTLLPGIRVIAAPGHTPGHSFYEIESRGHRMRVIGDIIHAAEVQLPRPDITVDYDADEALAAKTRASALAELARTHELVAAPHISFPGLGHVVRSGTGYFWMAIPYSAEVRQVGQWGSLSVPAVTPWLFDTKVGAGV